LLLLLNFLTNVNDVVKKENIIIMMAKK
jgi:hypothetical protein